MISTKLHKVDVNINYNETSSIISKLGTAGSNLSGVNGVGNCFSDKLSTFYSGLGDKTTEYISKIRSAITSLASLISSGINKYDKVDKDYYYQLLNILNNFEKNIDNFDINEARKFIKSISDEKLLKSHPGFSNNHGRAIQYSGHWQKDGYDIQEYDMPDGSRKTVKTDTKGNKVTRIYDNNNNLKEETVENIDGTVTIIEYDEEKNITKKTTKKNGKETIEYGNSDSRTEIIVEEDGTKKTIQYDKDNKKKYERQVNPDGSIVEIEYDENGNANRHEYKSAEDERNKKEKIQQYKSEQERKKAEEEKREAKKRQQDAENMQKQREQEEKEKRKKAEQEQSEKAQQERKKAEEEERKRGEEKNTDEES